MLHEGCPPGLPPLPLPVAAGHEISCVGCRQHVCQDRAPEREREREREREERERERERERGPRSGAARLFVSLTAAEERGSGRSELARVKSD